jgi:hypothetical protein
LETIIFPNALTYNFWTTKHSLCTDELFIRVHVSYEGIDMANPNAFLFNSSGVDISVSINNGAFFTISAADTTTWVPSTPATEPTMVNNTNPGNGELGLGKNTITLYPSTSGPASSANFTLNIPTSVTVSSLQLYLFWKDANNVAWSALNGGQIIEVSSTAAASQAA